MRLGSIQYIFTFSIILLIIGPYSCEKKSTKPESVKISALKGYINGGGSEGGNIEVLIVEYKPDYDTLGADTTSADSGFYYIDSLPATTVNVIFNDIVFTEGQEDFFTSKAKLLLSKGVNLFDCWLGDTISRSGYGEPTYADGCLDARFDTTIDSLTADEIVKKYGCFVESFYRYPPYCQAVIVIPPDSSVFNMVRILNFDFYVNIAYPCYLPVHGKPIKR